MGWAYGDLNGSGPQQVMVYLDYVGYNQAGNYSTWDWEVRYRGNGAQSWILDGNSWSLSGFAATSGTFQITSSNAGGDIVLGKGRFNKAHNADGYLSASSMTASINTNHSGIGDGSATISTGGIPRIPKRPDKMAAPTLNNPTVTGFDVRFTAPADNGGSAITKYTIQYAENSSFSAAATTTATTSPRVFTQQSPATEYWVRIRAENAIGVGDWSAASKITTLAALYYIDPETNVEEPVILYAWNGSDYELVDLQVDPELDGTFVTLG